MAEAAMSKGMKLFPIMDGPAIPWSVIEPHEQQAMTNHRQSLARLAQRGGLTANEAYAVLVDSRWRDIEALPHMPANERLLAVVSERLTRAF